MAVTVPINPEFGSRNLAQAVILVAYQWSKRADLLRPKPEDCAAHARPTRQTLGALPPEPSWSLQEPRTSRDVPSAPEGKKQRRS